MDFAVRDMDSMFGADSSDDEEDREVITPVSTTARSIPVDARLVSVKDTALGGGRGVFADRDLPAGFLVLSEVPVVTWPDGTDLEDAANLLEALHIICTNKNAVEVSKHLHPLSLAGADVEELETAKEIFAEDEEGLILADSGLTEDEVLRVLLTLQHNGFVSGLYQYLSLVNHSCDPNCIKFAPSASSLHASEIWTTRPVAAGEELTICYCTPLETTPRSMLDFLKSHHRFDCTCNRCSDALHGADVMQEQCSGRVADAGESFQEVLDNLGGEIKWANSDDPLADCKLYFSLMRKVNKAITHYVQDVKTALTECFPELDDAGIDAQLTKLIPFQQLMVRASKAGIAASIGCIKSIDMIESEEIKGSVKPYGLRTGIKRSGVSKRGEAAEEDGHAAGGLPSTIAGAEAREHGSSEEAAKQSKQSLIGYCAEAYIRHSLRCLTSQLRYLGKEHPDLIVSNTEMAAALNILHSIHFTIEDMICATTGMLPLWKEFFDNLAIEGEFNAIVSCCQSVDAPIDADIVPPTILSKLKKSIMSIHKQFTVEGKRLKGLYSVHMRYPESIRAHSDFNSSCRQELASADAEATDTRPSATSCFWGNKIIA